MEEQARYRSPFDDLIGTTVVEGSGERVVAILKVTEALHQPTGILHGGVFATLIETVASIGASLWLDGEGWAVGISNSTDFLRSVRDGELRAEATPLQQGRTLQLWQVEITDDADRRVAHGKVKLMNMRGPLIPS